MNTIIAWKKISARLPCYGLSIRIEKCTHGKKSQSGGGESNQGGGGGGHGNVISCVFRRAFSVNKNEGLCSRQLFILPIVLSGRLSGNGEKVKQWRHLGGYKQRRRRHQYQRPCTCVCPELPESSISHLSPHYNVSCLPFIE